MMEKPPSERWGQGENLTSDTDAIRIRKTQANKQSKPQESWPTSLSNPQSNTCFCLSLSQPTQTPDVKEA